MAKRQVTTPSKRKSVVADLVARKVIDSQEALVAALTDEGSVVTQATASRDLVELGAYRGKDKRGVVRYLLPAEQFSTRNPDLLLSAKASGNIAVLRTPPGGAQLLASALDHSELKSLLGTIAGDDTVLAISASAQGGARLIKEIEEYLSEARVKSSRSTQIKKR